jgi:hypothetical protein
MCVLLDPEDRWKCQSLLTNWFSITSQKTLVVVFLLTYTLGTMPSYNHLICFHNMRLFLRGCILHFISLIILFGCVGNMVPSDKMIVSNELGNDVKIVLAWRDQRKHQKALVRVVVLCGDT